MLSFFDVAGIGALTSPVLDELAITHSKDVDADITVRTGHTGPMSVHGNDVTVSDDATYLTLSVRNVVRKALM